MIVTFSISQSSASSKSGTSRCTSTPATTTNTSPEKTARKEQLEAAYKTQRDRIEQLEVFINRFRYTATKAKQVQSRIKELEKIERIQIPEEEKTVHFSFRSQAQRTHRCRVRQRRQKLWRARHQRAQGF